MATAAIATAAAAFVDGSIVNELVRPIDGRTGRHILDGQVWVPRRLVAG